MALEGVEVITSEGLAATYQSWNGEQLNWANILYNQICSKIVGKTTRNQLFFFNSTYLLDFCPILTKLSHIIDTNEEGEFSKSKRQ